MCLSVFQAALTLGSSSRQASCLWFHGDAPESNTPTTRPTLTWWRRLMPSSINQVFLWTACGLCYLRRKNYMIKMESFVVYPCFFVYFCLGSTITAEIQGVIDACVKLTGMPDLTLSFMVSFPSISTNATELISALQRCIFNSTNFQTIPAIRLRFPESTATGRCQLPPVRSVQALGSWADPLLHPPWWKLPAALLPRQFSEVSILFWRCS